MRGVCVCALCVEWKKTLFVPFFLGYPLFLKVYSWYRLSGSNRVLAFFKQTVHLEKQSIDYTEEECLFTAVVFTGLCSLFMFREKSLSLLLCLFSNKLFFPDYVVFTVWCIHCLLKLKVGHGSWNEFAYSFNLHFGFNKKALQQGRNHPWHWKRHIPQIIRLVTNQHGSVNDRFPNVWLFIPYL